MRTRVLTLVAAGSLAVGSCHHGSTVPSARVPLIAQDSGRTVRVHVTDVLVLTLNANASTGFRWVLSRRPDPTVLELVGSDYIAPTTGLVGAPGQEVWRFRALQEGSTSLELTYERSGGEVGGQPFQVDVEVTSGG